jgi:hypothetical protein
MEALEVRHIAMGLSPTLVPILRLQDAVTLLVRG